MKIDKKIEDKLEQGRVYRDMKLEVNADEDHVVEGYATTFNEPYLLFRDGDYEVWEQVGKHALDESDMSDVIMQYNHEGRVFARLSNKTLALGTDDHGFKMRATLGGTELGRQLYEEIKGGYTNKMSWGFIVAEDKKEITEDNEAGTYKVLRTILRVSKVFDVSAVSIPANDATEISARNYSEGVIAEIRQELEEKAKMEARRKANINKIKILAELGA